MSKSIEVLERALNEIVREIEKCGEAGGVGRVQSYAPVLINLSKAIEIIKALEAPEVAITMQQESFADKMQKAKAAKKFAAENK